MSEVQAPPSAQPFVATTTRAIERANHLLSVKSHPGFIDILAILQEIVKTAIDNEIDYPGWDTNQLWVLKARAQAAKELYNLLVVKIQDAIQDGIMEARRLEAEQQLPPKTAQEIIEQGDHVRREVLEKFAEMDTSTESRAPGSF